MLRANSTREIDEIIVRTIKGESNETIGNMIDRSTSWVRNFKTEDAYKNRRAQIAEMVEAIAPVWPTQHSRSL